MMLRLVSYFRWRIRTELNLLRRKRARRVTKTVTPHSRASKRGWETRRAREAALLRRGPVA